MSLVEIHRSNRSAACEHRAFVLRAVGIGSEIVRVEDFFVLFVEPGAVQLANDQLERYYAENAAQPKLIPVPNAHAAAWIAPTVYSLVMLIAAFLAGRSFFGFDWYDAGALPSSIQSSHQWWRAVTALTLHADHQHLLSNIGFGSLFAYAAARLIGYGITLSSIFVAAILGNILDSLLMPATHVSIGASTIVFATLGLVSAYSWRIQLSGRLQWAHRWAPLIVGIMLLGFLGANGENTDVLAHLTGFFFGGLFGVGLARCPQSVLEKRSLQGATALLPIGAVVAAWLLAATLQR